MASQYNAVPADQFPPEFVAQNKGPWILGVCISLTALSTIFVLLRIFTRQKILGRMYSDDYFVICATISEWINVILTIFAVKAGNGRHFDLLTQSGKEHVVFFSILGFTFGIISFTVPKLAVVALLVRLMNLSKWHKIFLWALSLLSMAALIGCVIILYAQCTPVSSQWDFSIKGKCISPWILINYSIFAGGLSAFADLYLALYPAYVLWGLQMNLRKKLSLCVALGIGSVASVVAVYKCTRLPSLATKDYSYNTSDLGVWTTVEGSTIVIASCIPILRPLVEVVFGRRMLGGSSAYKYRHGTSGDPGGDIQLSKNSRITPRNANSSQQVSNYTMGSLAGDPEIESQESILPKKASPTLGATPIDRYHITRTDVITVTYNQKDVTDDLVRHDTAATGGMGTSWMKV